MTKPESLTATKVEEEEMIALIEKEDSQSRILSPVVGFYSEMPREKTFVTGGAMIGKLTVLNTSFFIPYEFISIIKYTFMTYAFKFKTI